MEVSHSRANSQLHTIQKVEVDNEGGLNVIKIDGTESKKVEWQKADSCALFYKIMVATSVVLVILGALALTSALLPNAASITFISSVAHATSVVAGAFSTSSLNLAIFTLSLAGGLALGGGFGWAYNSVKASENRRLAQGLELNRDQSAVSVKAESNKPDGKDKSSESSSEEGAD